MNNRTVSLIWGIALIAGEGRLAPAIAQALARYIIGGDDARSLLEVQQVTSETRETVLTNGTVKAVIATYTITPERAKKIDFAGPYFVAHQTLLTRRNDDTITGATTLDGKTYTHDVGTLAEARVKVFETIRHAPRTTYPLTLSVEDPDGTNVLTLFEDGKVEVQEPGPESAPEADEDTPLRGPWPWP